MSGMLLVLENGYCESSRTAPSTARMRWCTFTYRFDRAVEVDQAELPERPDRQGLKVEMVLVEIVERVDSERFDLLRKVVVCVGFKLQPDRLPKLCVRECGVGVLNDDRKAVGEAYELGVLRSSRSWGPAPTSHPSTSL